jgi:hypothetical protein
MLSLWPTARGILAGNEKLKYERKREPIGRDASNWFPFCVIRVFKASAAECAWLFAQKSRLIGQLYFR